MDDDIKGLPADDAKALLFLRNMWHDFYAIRLEGGIWTAKRHGDKGEPMKAISAVVMREMVSRHYNHLLQLQIEEAKRA